MSRELLNYIYKLDVIVVCRDGIFWFNNPNRVNWLEIIYYWWLLLLCLLLKYYLLKMTWKSMNDLKKCIIHLRSAATDYYLFSFIKSIIHWCFSFFFVHHNNYKNVLHARNNDVWTTRTGSTHNMRCSCVNCQTFLTW